MEHEMDNLSQGYENGPNNIWGVLRGLLIGGLIGAGTMLLLAPQSGKETRAQIRQKSLELRDQATEAIEDAVAQVGDKAHHIRADVSKQTKELEQRGQDMVDGQKKRWSPVVEAGKTAIQGS
jgi:gas vesicle protein